MHFNCALFMALMTSVAAVVVPSTDYTDIYARQANVPYRQDAMDRFSRVAAPPSAEYPIAPNENAPNAPQ